MMSIFLHLLAGASFVYVSIIVLLLFGYAE